MGSSGSGRGRVAAGLGIVAVLTCSAALARDKTDVITLRNGDRITGEISKLEYGQLQLKTDDMGTVSIEWDSVVAIESRYEFDVEQIGGKRFHGVLTSSQGGRQLTVETRSGPQLLAADRITRIAPLESTFWSRIDGSFSVGYNYAKSTDVAVISGSFDSTYRAETVVASLGADLNSSTSPDRGTLDREQLAFSYRWLRPSRNFWVGIASVERNEELGIDNRIQLGGGFGRYVYQTAHSEIAAFAGVTFNREQAIDSVEGQESAEGIIGAGWRIYRLDEPKTSLTSEIALYPSITESDRYRGHADVSLRHELIKDFFIDLSFYFDYDSQPLGDGAVNDDYGITTSLGYSF